MSEPEGELHRLALAMERLNGTVETGFATVRGDINLLARAEQGNRLDIEKIEDRVSGLEARRFPVPMIGGMCGVAAVVLSTLQLIGKG